SGPRVMKVTGTATVDGAEAYEGMAIKETSVLETKAGAHMEFTMFSGALMQMKENSKVEAGKNADWAKAKKKDGPMKLVARTLWSYLPKGSSYEVATPNAVAGARGTVFFVQTTAPDQTYVCDCDGEIELTIAGKMKPVKSKMAHVGTIASGADKKAKSKPT